MPIEQRVLVSAIIIEDHKVLMQKRTDDLESHKDKWTTPSGIVEINERPEDTVIREVKEELNLDIKIIQMIPSVDSFPNHKDKFHLIYFGYLCEIVSGDIHNQDDEGDISDVAWFDIRHLDKDILIRGTLPPVEAGYKIWLELQKK